MLRATRLLIWAIICECERLTIRDEEVLIFVVWTCSNFHENATSVYAEMLEFIKSNGLA
jgi:hypothetical protein